jgi:hypothetical protein
MRQLIVGTDVLAAADGGIMIQKKNLTTGVITELGDADTIATAPEIRFVRNGAGDVVSSASPWIKGTDIVGYAENAGAAQSAQSLAITCTNGTSGDPLVTVKLIETAAGYEPFERANFEVDPAAFAANLDAAIQANRPAFLTGESVSGSVVTLVGTTYAGGDAGLTNIQIAFDANGGTATAVLSNTPASKGSGVGYFLVDQENEQLGREKSDYYRATHLPQSNDLFAVAGTSYDMYSFNVQNSALGQIRGVDNMRNIQIAVPATTSTWLSGDVTNGFTKKLIAYLASVPGAFVPTAI